MNFILLTEVPSSTWNTGDEPSRLTWIDPDKIVQLTRMRKGVCTEVRLGEISIRVEEAPAEIMTKIIHSTKGIDLETAYEKQERQA